MKLILIFASLFLTASCCYAQQASTEVMRNHEKIVVVNLNDNLHIPLSKKYVHINDIPPRYQWEHNSGYCGEVSMISAGLYYGQYLSQYDAREIICKKDQTSCEMLLGLNDNTLAHSLRLKFDTIRSQDSQKFLTWVKKHVLMGHPVVIGVLNNERILYDNPAKNAGQPDYDHIVPVMGIGSGVPLHEKKHQENDVILFSDNGLITVNGDNPPVPIKHNALYYYSYSFKDFVGSRQKANKKNGHSYTLVDLPDKTMGKDIYNYGIAILGVHGDKETLPIRISTNYNYEAPYIDSKSNKRPKPMPLQLTVKVSKVIPGTKYNLYQYSHEDDVPYKDFNHSKKYKERTEFTLSSGTEFSISLNIKSNEKVFFRCVKAE